MGHSRPAEAGEFRGPKEPWRNSLMTLGGAWGVWEDEEGQGLTSWETAVGRHAGFGGGGGQGQASQGWC